MPVVFAGAVACDGVGSSTAMSEGMLETRNPQARAWRWGFALAAAAILYIAAVIGFIVIY